MSHNSRARNNHGDVFCLDISVVLFLGLCFCHNVEIFSVLVLILN